MKIDRAKFLFLTASIAATACGSATSPNGAVKGEEEVSTNKGSGHPAAEAQACRNSEIPATVKSEIHSASEGRTYAASPHVEGYCFDIGIAHTQDAWALAGHSASDGEPDFQADFYFRKCETFNHDFRKGPQMEGFKCLQNKAAQHPATPSHGGGAPLHIPTFRDMYDCQASALANICPASGPAAENACIAIAGDMVAANPSLGSKIVNKKLVGFTPADCLMGVGGLTDGAAVRVAACVHKTISKYGKVKDSTNGAFSSCIEQLSFDIFNPDGSVPAQGPSTER